MNNLYNILHKFITTVSNLKNESVFKDNQYDELTKKLNDNSLDFPVIHISEISDFYINENQENIDLNNEVKTSVKIAIKIISNKVDDIISIEELINNTLSCNYELSNIDNNRYISNAYITLSKEDKPVRKPILNYKYISSIIVICQDFLLPKYIENLIRFELEYNTQVKVLKHLNLLECLYFKLLEKHQNSEDIENKEKIKRQIDQLENQLSEMFVFKNLCSNTFSHKNHSFQYCYHMLNNNKANKKCDIKSIINSDEQRIKKEDEKKKQAIAEKIKKEKESAERLEKIKLHFSKNGDTQLNRYTDSIIQDLQNNLQLEDISIYGGSTFSKWYIDYEEKTIHYPNILITDSVRYNLDLKTYENETKDGNIICHKYDTCALPISYGFSLVILSDSLEKNKEIENSILSNYSQKKQIKITDYRNQEEFTILNIQAYSTSDFQRKEFGNIHRSIISFKKFQNVIYLTGYDSEECKNNNRLQLRLLQQAEYILLLHNSYTQAKKGLKIYYKPFIERKHSFFGFLDTADYRKVKNLYNNNMPISKDLFDSAMENIVKYYPDLYNQFINGWSYSQIEKNIDGYINFYKSRFDMLMDFLEIPEQSDISIFPETIKYYNRESIVYFINKMTNSYCELKDVISEYTTEKCKEIQAKREQERIEREERAAMRAEQEYYGGNSGNGILRTAMGVALGNKMSSNRNKKNAKRDLMGTTVCQYGRKGYCMGCRAKNKCTRG